MARLNQRLGVISTVVAWIIASAAHVRFTLPLLSHCFHASTSSHVMCSLPMLCSPAAFHPPLPSSASSLPVVVVCSFCSLLLVMPLKPLCSPCHASVSQLVLFRTRHIASSHSPTRSFPSSPCRRLLPSRVLPVVSTARHVASTTARTGVH